MASSPVSQAGLQGLSAAFARAQDAANRIAVPADSPESLVEALVDLKSAEQEAAASARALEAGERTLGTLIDVLA